MNEEVENLVREKIRIARDGGDGEEETGMFERVREIVGGIGGGIKRGLGGRQVSNGEGNVEVLYRDSITPEPAAPPASANPNYGAIEARLYKEEEGGDDRGMSLLKNDYLQEEGFHRTSSALTPRGEEDLIQPGGRDKHKSCFRRAINKLGVDFLHSEISSVRDKFQSVVVDSVFARTMSSTGFVTFTNLQTVAMANASTLSHKVDTLDTALAPEPRDIYWPNCHVTRPVRMARIQTASAGIMLGVLLFWVNLLNGYLPVVTLLGLIQLLPFFFQWVATSYETRMTHSDIQSSIMKRFFVYQLANIYISITAGSIFENLTAILDNPTSALQVLSDTVPTVVGYFMSLIMTKILAGLPVVLLRFGALLRMGFLRLCFQEAHLTQRELNEVYRPQEFLYGWEYPTQLLVIVICFTYSVISPVILLIGAVYFYLALIVYKLQLLYVYTPLYEGGGELFPSVCHRTFIGLCCGQVSLLAYLFIRVSTKGWQPLVLIPLPFYTIYTMNRMKAMYDIPSKSLSLERAVVLDRQNKKSGDGADLVDSFDKHAYRQPLLDPKELHIEPEPYRTVWVAKAARAGKHILCEKPIAVDLASLKSIVSVCEEMDVELMDGVMFMHHPRLSTLISTLPSLTPLHVSSAFTFLGDDDFFKNNIRTNGGDPLGCLGDLGYYNIRISLSSFNYTPPSHAHGVILEENEHGVPITMSCGMRWEDGRSCTFTCSFRMLTQQWVKIACKEGHVDIEDFVIPNEEERAGFEIVKEDFVEEARRCSRTKEYVEVENAKPQQTLMWEEFARRVYNRSEGGGGQRDGFSHEVMTQLCIEACMRSAREGSREVEVKRNL
ncbi:hypothetical protein TrRE_jg7516 [Triparma retinervis]|uniref:Uncharacterized protein n=1 Tax=Triparma retinervis TaxID=2557542 RepID=A0A9W7KT63_9STRA|nr:hypothetical protein TrRE_jg7516 [Triparma retinervis]